MDGFYKYLTQSSRDLNWGVALTVAGYSVIEPGTQYPPMEHPAGFQFTIQQRRVISEYQLIYITQGEGTFESQHFLSAPVIPGTIFLLFPGEWHRYFPNSNQGWTEYYLGFRGDYIDNLVKQNFLNVEKPLFDIGIKDSILQLFAETFELVKEERSGYQQIASSNLINILGKTLFHSSNNYFDKETEDLVRESRQLLAEQVSGDVDWDKLSNSLGISYSKFRKTFKSYAGMPPGQYLLQLKVSKARELLLQTNMPLKTIADTLGFRDQYYFNSLFRQKTGLSPGLYRKTYTLG